jgi:hypothetical protein
MIYVGESGNPEFVLLLYSLCVKFNSLHLDGSERANDPRPSFLSMPSNVLRIQGGRKSYVACTDYLWLVPRRRHIWVGAPIHVRINVEQTPIALQCSFNLLFTLCWKDRHFLVGGLFFRPSFLPPWARAASAHPSCLLPKLAASAAQRERERDDCNLQLDFMRRLLLLWLLIVRVLRKGLSSACHAWTWQG